MRNTNQGNRFFKMGTAMAVSELFGSGRLGSSEEETVRFTRAFLGSFGIRDMGDIEEIGIKGPYMEDLYRIYGCSG